MDVEWFLGKAPSWKEKRLAIYGVGATPWDAPEILEFLLQNHDENVCKVHE